MGKIDTIAMVAAFVTTIAPHASRAAIFHVAPEGDDAASGAAARPWRTLQRAADVAQPGDTVRVRQGDYDGFNLEKKAGTPERPIVFRADPGARVIRPGPRPRNVPLNTAVRGFSWPKWPHGIYVWGSSHVTIEGFEIVGMPPAELDPSGKPLHRGGAGIHVQVSDHVTLRKNRADDNGRWGIFSAFADDLVVEDNECSRSRAEHGIYASNSADRPILRRNRVWGNCGSGIQLNADNNFDSPAYRARAGVVDGIITGAVIEGNVIVDNGSGGGAAINLDGVQDSLIRGNVLVDNHASGVALFQIDGAEGSRCNRVLDNTILMAEDARYAIQIASCPETLSSTCPSANRPPIPEWVRPPSRATGSTGNVILRNTLLHANPERGSIRIDPLSLDEARGFRSDFNVVSDRFAISTTEGFEGDRVLSFLEWRKITGQDFRSLHIDAPRRPAFSAQGIGAAPGGSIDRQRRAIAAALHRTSILAPGCLGGENPPRDKRACHRGRGK
ncbi:right-handed parallel beta-helix repeat-containing protein [Polyangium sp. y55x31]|uniref:right-handed parallel beta-helix repeat-containing protein n=1 Tax=Polyangium sp. y55x31 TaxID=3042688 RepID=UPI002482B263|nr:right-handed parallel beta-helix repeat-containing protein [Polyangium sp. y55x31]MDI1480204.1 right-handed parallel beta-helix repeat-containing protein [Polyangium sp. y55x31]